MGLPEPVPAPSRFRNPIGKYRLSRTSACIGCGKCFDVCPHGAIEMKNDETGKFKLLAYIDYTKCKLCRKCAPVCPTNAIHEVNFPPRKEPVKTEPAKTEA